MELAIHIVMQSYRSHNSVFGHSLGTANGIHLLSLRETFSQSQLYPSIPDACM